MLGTLRRWAEQYGGAFQLRAGWLGQLLLGGPRVTVVLSDPVAVHELLHLREDVAAKSPRYYSNLDSVLHPDAEVSSVTAATAPQWALVRRSLLHAFSNAELRQDFEVAKAKALSLARLLVELGPGVVVDADDAALRLSLDVAGISKLGYDFEAVESRDEVLLLRLLGEVAAEWDARRGRLLPAALAPWLDDAAAAGRAKCRILQDFIEQELWSDIAERGPPPADDVTLAAQLARLRTPPARASTAALPLERTLSELAAQLMMAHEPTGHAIAWALYCVAGSKPVQDKLVAELKREGIYDRPQNLAYDALPRLTYLDCVVREALRLYPTMPCPATVRTVKKDVVLAGRWRVPSGSEVWVDVFAMHRSPRLWLQPDRFNPERWADQQQQQGQNQDQQAVAVLPYDGLCTVESDPADESPDAGAVGGAGAAAAAASVDPPAAAPADSGADAPLCSPRAFMPFGAGPRSCLGQRLAVAEVKATLAVLLSFVVFERTGEAAGAAAAPGSETGEAAMWRGLFLRPVGGLPLLIAPRKRG